MFGDYIVSAERRLHGLDLAYGVEKAFLQAKGTRPYEDLRPIFLEGGERAARFAPAAPNP